MLTLVQPREWGGYHPLTGCSRSLQITNQCGLMLLGNCLFIFCAHFAVQNLGGGGGVPPSPGLVFSVKVKGYGDGCQFHILCTVTSMLQKVLLQHYFRRYCIINLIFKINYLFVFFFHILAKNPDQNGFWEKKISQTQFPILLFVQELNFAIVVRAYVIMTSQKPHPGNVGT